MTMTGYFTRCTCRYCALNTKATEYFQANVVGTQNVLEAARLAGVKNLYMQHLLPVMEFPTSIQLQKMPKFDLNTLMRLQSILAKN